MARLTKFEITEQTSGSRLVVRIGGELDMNTAGTLSEHIDNHLNGEITAVTIDLRELAFMDSSGLRLLIELNHRSHAEHWQLRMLAPQDEAAAVVLQITGADTALPFEPESPSA
jgi:anti-sigma B factor antagonist